MPRRLAVLLFLLGCHSDKPSPTRTTSPDDSAAHTDSPAAPDSGGTTAWTVDAPWRREEQAAPGSITFTELLYHPVGDDPEWLELHNPMALDMDLSGWSLSGGVSFTFAEGAVVPAGGYVVVASEAGMAGALGAYDGKLSNSGERVSLYSRSGRLIDTVAYGDDAPWTVAADGSGASLAKISPAAPSDHAENWTFSAVIGGTPGASNQLDPLALPSSWTLIEPDAVWQYDTSGAYPAADWADPAYDDSGWDSGQATFFAGAVEEEVAATAWATADNYFALYLGEADGSNLRLVGEDTDGNWWTVEEIALLVSPQDYLYLAAWELTGDASSPQMTIAEVELPDDMVGTSATDFLWVLGPADTNPGGLPASAPPSETALRTVIEDANIDGAWAWPGVEAGRTSSPWSSVSSAFTDAAMFIWGDSFDYNSVTNIDDTYALFRSAAPVLAPPGNVELSDVPTTVTFRTRFSFEGDPAATTLYLDCDLDDGAVFYLNGVEVLRENLPSTRIDATTRALTDITDDFAVYAELSAAPLVSGQNVLAVEVHQAEAADADLRFGCTLTAEQRTDVGAPTILLNEVPPAGGAWVEVYNASTTPRALGGLILAASTGEQVILSGGTLSPGALSLIEPGLSVVDGDRLFLYSADGQTLLDAVRVRDRLRGRDEEGGDWRYPAEATPGADNRIPRAEAVVINEIMYNPLAGEEWIELYNRSEEAVDLGGWQLVDAVAYAFEEGTTLEPGGYLVVARDAAAAAEDLPGVDVVGDYGGQLGNSGDRILLLDARGNPADEVRYFDSGRWPSAADGGGSSLELRDPWADNAAAEAWAASDERSRSAWETVRIRGEAAPSAVGPDGAWDELVLGLLDAGEVLIDDLHVIRDPDGAAVELIQNSTFDDAARWRLLGTHRHSELVSDPEDSANAVLRLVATGPLGHMHNHAETTLLEPIRTQEYEISFRARWVSGSNQLNTRLYFNRLPRTTRLTRPARAGTPGAANTAWVDNIGPTFAGLRQSVAVPAPGESVVISVEVADPDGVAGVRLLSSVDGAPFEAVELAEGEPGRWSGPLDGQAPGTIVQFYVEAEDTLGATAFFPAGGPDSRAMFVVEDGKAATSGLHNLRILLTPEDEAWLHDDVNLMSDDTVGATVVYDEAEVFYDVGVRLKGSERGRPSSSRLGYGIRFQDEQPLRGHTSVLIDRSEGVNFGQRELLMNLVMTRAGAVFGEHNDLVQLIAPRAEYTGSAELQLDRFSNLVLASQFADGDSGTRFEYELIYYPSTTDDGTAEGLKLPQPDSVIGTPLDDLGDDKEAYRWNFLIKNNLDEDRYDEIMALCQLAALSDEAFVKAAPTVIDVEEWLHAFAFATLSGTTDQYGVGSQHNAQFYVRPEDGRVLYFPHDLDFFFSSPTTSAVGNAELARLLREPAYLRSYYGYLNDIIAQAYSTDYLAPWCDQLGTLLPAQDFDAHCAFIDARASWILSGSSDSVLSRFPALEFHITTSGGEDFSATGASVTLTGEAWVDVREIALEGEPLEITWLDARTWQVAVPVQTGANPITLDALDLHGANVGTDTITVTVE